MQKSYCDLCEKQILPNTFNGGLMRAKDVATIQALALKGFTQPQVESKVVQEVWDLCDDCQIAVWAFAEDRQNKLKKGRFRMAKIYIDSLKKHVLER